MESTKTVNEKNEKKPMTPKQRTIFILKIVGNVIFYAVIFALFLFSIMNINSGGQGGIPNLFGKGYLSVQSNSMEADQSKLPSKYEKYSVKSFNKGDLIHVNMLDDNSKKNLKVGDVITFYSQTLKALNTHRIVYTSYSVNFSQELSSEIKTNYPLINNICYDAGQGKSLYDEGNDAEISFNDYLDKINTENNLNITATFTLESLSTQGDKSVSFRKYTYNPARLSMKAINYELSQTGDADDFVANSADIKAIVTGVSGGMGSFMDTIQKNWLFVFVIPIAIVLIIEVVLVVKNILDLRREKTKAIDLADHEAQMAELQNEKERMRQELLAELRAQGALPTEEAKQEAPAEKAEEPEAAPVVEEKAPVEETKVEETPAEDEKSEEVEEVKEETTEETPVETKKEEKEPVVNNEALEPDMDIEENEDEK